MRMPDIETTLRIYHGKTEISNTEIKELFGNVSSKTAAKLKKQVKKEMINQNVSTWRPNNVNTRIAYEVWQIDVDDLER